MKTLLKKISFPAELLLLSILWSKTEMRKCCCLLSNESWYNKGICHEFLCPLFHHILSRHWKNILTHDTLCHISQVSSI